MEKLTITNLNTISITINFGSRSSRRNDRLIPRYILTWITRITLAGIYPGVAQSQGDKANHRKLNGMKTSLV